MQIRGSIALVSGANRGIGRALVEALLDRGARRVYATGRDLATLDGVVALGRGRVRPLKLDVTNPGDARAAAGAAGDVNLLINNAGIATAAGAADTSVDMIRETMETNFFGLVHVTNAFLPTLREHRGAIVNILTIVALASSPILAAYTASKAAGWSLTQSLRADLARHGITVHGVFPGAVDTDMIRSFTLPKTPAIDVARAVLDGIEAGTEDIFPDPMAQQLYAAWRQDHKAVERQLAAS
jgi:NAD(P)-dependent dehydrogenase (short-subunit alcohol dehydrogenase family)